MPLSSSNSISGQDSGNAFAQECISPPSGMISWWTGDGNAKDLFSRNFGFAEGNPAFVGATVERGFNLDGRDDRIRIPSSTDLNPSSQITIEAWIKPTPEPDNPVQEWSIVSKFNHSSPGGGDDDSYYLGLNSIRSIRWQIDTGISTVVDNILDVPLPSNIAGTFHHIAATYDGVTMKVYLDGSLVGEKTASGPIHDTQTDMFIGATLSSGSLARTFKGVIDEVGVYSRPLLQEEIKPIFDAKSGGKCKDIVFVDNPEVTIRTDRPSYTYGEDIIISGEVSHLGSAQHVNLFITSSDGTIFPLAETVPIVSSNNQTRSGSYSHTLETFSLADTSFLGKRTITASYADSTAVTEIGIEMPTKTGAQITLETDKASYSPNDTITIIGTITPTSNVTIGLASPSDAGFLQKEVQPLPSGSFSISHKLGSQAEYGRWTVIATPKNSLDLKQISFNVTGPPRHEEPKVVDPPWKSFLKGRADIKRVDNNQTSILLKNIGELDIPLVYMKANKGSIQKVIAKGWQVQTLSARDVILTSDNMLPPGKSLNMTLFWKGRPSGFSSDKQNVTEAAPALNKPIGLSFTPPDLLEFADPNWRDKIQSQNEGLPDMVDMRKNSNNFLIGQCDLKIPITALDFEYPMEACNENDGQPEFGQGILPEWIPVTRDCSEPANIASCNGDKKEAFLRAVVLEGVVVEGKLPRKVLLHNEETSEDQVAEPPHISVVDGTWNHYTHDFAFQVKPFTNYENLLGWNVADSSKQLRRATIEVEWESGLAAGNQFFTSLRNPADPNSRQTIFGYPANICQPYNDVGKSCGFFTKGHDSSSIASENPADRRPDTIWNWPSVGDIIHAEGFWVWDRGHSPADKTEIHPARFVAIQRHLPANLVYWQDKNTGEIYPPDFEDSFPNHENGTAYCPSDYLPSPSEVKVCGYGIPPTAKEAPLLATRVDVFANGDGGAIWNNRDPPNYEIKTIPHPIVTRTETKQIGSCGTDETITCYGIQRTPMSEKDYTFVISHDLPRPSPDAELKVVIAKHKGDTFGFEPIITKYDEHDQTTAAGEQGWPPHVHVTIPWKTMQEIDTAVFARTFYVYWEDKSEDAKWGTTEDYANETRIYKVSMDRFVINDNMDTETPCWFGFAGIFGTAIAPLLGVGLTVGTALFLACCAGLLQLVSPEVAIGGVAAGLAGPLTLTVAFGVGTYYAMGACEPDGEYRAFYEVGGKWFSLNEWLLVDDQVTTNSDEGILRDGLGDTGERLGDNDIDEPEGCPEPHGDPCWPFTIVNPGVPGSGPGSKGFIIYLPKGQDFKIHADGWEADGVDRHFGKIIDPNPVQVSPDGTVTSPNNVQQLSNWFNDNLMNPDTFVHGIDDDPVGMTDIRWKYTEFTDVNNIGVLEGKVPDFDYLGNPWVPCGLLIDAARNENPNYTPSLLQNYVGCDHTPNAFHLPEGTEWCHTAFSREKWIEKLDRGEKIVNRKAGEIYRPYSDDPSCVVNAREQFSTIFTPTFENGQFKLQRWPYYQPFPLVLHSEGKYELGTLERHSGANALFRFPTDPNKAFSVFYSISEIPRPGIDN
jgi:Concanavalin A-like lectin/glucanases superfamily